MTKINQKYHRTKTGVIKRNPVKNNDSKYDRFIEHINSYASQPIRDKSFAKDLIKERLGNLINHPIWDNLSKNRETYGFFNEVEALDPTLIVLFVEIK